MKKDIIYSKYNDLVEDIYMSYNKIKVVDNLDFQENSPYTIFYLAKNESFDKFKDLWEDIKKKEYDFYEEIISIFEDKAKDIFDYFEMGTLNVYTEQEFELEI